MGQVLQELSGDKAKTAFDKMKTILPDICVSASGKKFYQLRRAAADSTLTEDVLSLITAEEVKIAVIEGLRSNPNSMNNGIVDKLEKWGVLDHKFVMDAKYIMEWAASGGYEAYSPLDDPNKRAHFNMLERKYKREAFDRMNASITPRATATEMDEQSKTSQQYKRA